MYEASKAVMRRLFDSRFATRYFIGNGIDIGAGPDPLDQYTEQFPLMNSCRSWDLADGDAQYLATLMDESLDFVHSSHCLEHMLDPQVALTSWIRVLKPGGHLVVTVPDEDLYEQGVFPSTFNTDHKWTFTMLKLESWSPKSINLFALLSHFAGVIQIVKVEQIDAGYRFKMSRRDQTLSIVSECAIEFILRKPVSEDAIRRGRLPSSLPVRNVNQLEMSTITVITDSLTRNCSVGEALQLALDEGRKGNFSVAEAIYLQLTALDEASAETHKNYGNTLLSLNKRLAAEQAYRRALELNPDYAEVFNNLGNLFRLEERFEESNEAFRKALDLWPDNAEIQNNYGFLLMDLGQIEDAEKVFRRAILLKPDFAMAYRNRGNALRSFGRFKLAAKCYRQAIDLDPGCADDYIGLGQTLLYLGDIDEAEKFTLHALELQPSSVFAYCTLGNIKLVRGHIDEAESEYIRSISILPSYSSALFNLSLVKLLKEDLLEGFKLYENRFHSGNIASFNGIKDMFRALNHNKRWQGEQVSAKTLLVITEQGAGDSLMMMRYLPLLKQKGFDTLQIYCETSLKRLFMAIPAVDHVFSKDEPLMLTGFDYYCPMMSFPYLFQTCLDNIPATIPYLEIPEVERIKWRALLKGVSGLKVGLVWAGNSNNFADKDRSIPLSDFKHLFTIAGMRLISLQKGELSGQSAELETNCIDYMDMCHDYLDTAALIMELDLVITVDTSVAHLAGALGKRVWLLNRFGSEWRWMLNRENSPWYPTMRIFNQKETGHWAPVIDTVAVELQRFIDSGNNLSVEGL